MLKPLCVVSIGLMCSLIMAATALAAPATDDFCDKGVQAYHQGDLAGALKHLKEAIVREPYNPTPHYHLANTYVRAGRLDLAKREYTLCLALDPSAQLRQYCQQALAHLNKSQPPSGLPGSKGMLVPKQFEESGAAPPESSQEGNPKDLEMLPGTELLSLLKTGALGSKLSKSCLEAIESRRTLCKRFIETITAKAEREIADLAEFIQTAPNVVYPNPEFPALKRHVLEERDENIAKMTKEMETEQVRLIKEDLHKQWR